MNTMPSGLRYSERKLYAECPEARPALERLARMRAGRRKGRSDRWMAYFLLAVFVTTLPLAVLHPMQPGILGLPQWFYSASSLALTAYFWREGRRA